MIAKDRKAYEIRKYNFRLHNGKHEVVNIVQGLADADADCERRNRELKGSNPEEWNDGFRYYREKTSARPPIGRRPHIGVRRVTKRRGRGRS
jgi:hypothetical protein